MLKKNRKSKQQVAQRKIWNKQKQKLAILIRVQQIRKQRLKYFQMTLIMLKKNRKSKQQKIWNKLIQKLAILTSIKQNKQQQLKNLQMTLIMFSQKKNSKQQASHQNSRNKLIKQTPKSAMLVRFKQNKKLVSNKKNSQQELKSIKNVRTEEKHERTDFSSKNLEQTPQNLSFQHQHQILPIDVVQKLYPDCRTQVLYYVLQLQADNTILAFSKNLLLTTKNSVTTKNNKNDILQDSQKFGQNVTNEKIRNDLVTQILEKFSKLENEKKSRFLDQLLRKFLSANIACNIYCM
eukprot:TRINITY_DN29953_c0_g1_i6.p2 TRINITY_DN29953_c0_g1~~TRINITY_DN29953_c0_g1_i6.p2  ORF type:complete len:292 (-),score=6.17 TRINITY_DN29953_c0_g1_i6:36-911(-)